jgi:hypothetical protein
VVILAMVRRPGPTGSGREERSERPIVLER